MGRAFTHCLLPRLRMADSRRKARRAADEGGGLDADHQTNPALPQSRLEDYC